MSDLSHGPEAHKDALFPGDERDPKMETTTHRAVARELRRRYPSWVKANDLHALTGIPSSDRRARELAEVGLIERTRIGRQVAYRLQPFEVALQGALL